MRWGDIWPLSTPLPQPLSITHLFFIYLLSIFFTNLQLNLWDLYKVSISQIQSEFSRLLYGDRKKMKTKHLSFNNESESFFIFEFLEICFIWEEEQTNRKRSFKLEIWEMKEICLYKLNA